MDIVHFGGFRMDARHKIELYILGKNVAGEAESFSNESFKTISFRGASVAFGRSDSKAEGSPFFSIDAEEASDETVAVLHDALKFKSFFEAI